MRLYNGCPDSELKAKWDSIEKAKKQLQKQIPEAHCTYFPKEEKWQVHVWGKMIGGFFDTELAAIESAIETTRVVQ